MKMKCMQVSILFCLLFISSLSVSARVWRVNNNTGVFADFIQLSAAAASPMVLTDDTIYVEGSAGSYNSVTLSKRLVIIGTGYFLNENTGLQDNINDSWVGSIVLDSLASGSHIYGVRANQLFINSNVDNIQISRCHLSISANSLFANSKLSNWGINKCYLTNFSFSGVGYVFENLLLTNCIVSGPVVIASSINSLIRNNILLSTCTINNCYISNNIFLNSHTLQFTNSTVRYNISQTNNLPVGNGNQINITQANLFTLTGSTDGRYQLRSGSPAIATGETVNGVTPDCGAFGTADPYRLSGIPAIPTIYGLTVPATVPFSASSMTITVSTRSNN